MIDITDDNIRYWWLQIRKHQYRRGADLLVSAVAFLREQKDVIVHLYIGRRGPFLCWYLPDLFDLDLTAVTEVYIDSTHGMKKCRAVRHHRLRKWIWRLCRIYAHGKDANR